MATNQPEPLSFFSHTNLLSLAILVLLFLAARWSLLAPYKVSSASMEPTFAVGDRIVVNKAAYDLRLPFTNYVLAKTGAIERGEVIVFRSPADPSEYFVKRVVGIFGDEISIDAHTLFVNGVKQPQEWLREVNQRFLYREQLGNITHCVMFLSQPNEAPTEQHFSFKVGEDSVFVLGDNRDHSLDSRSWGRVPLEYVVGRASMVLFSAYEDDVGIWRFRFERVGLMSAINSCNPL